MPFTTSDKAQAGRSSIRTDRRWLNAILAMTISAACLIGYAGYDFFERDLQAKIDAVRVVNLSGKQRMLSQRIISLVHMLPDSKDADVLRRTREQLAEAIGQMRHNADILANGGEGLPSPSSLALRKLYFDDPDSATAQVRIFLDIAENLLDQPIEELGPQQPAFEEIQTLGNGSVLDILGRIVLQYQVEIGTKLARQEAFIISGLIAFLALAAIGAYVVVRRLHFQHNARKVAATTLDQTLQNITDGYVTINETGTVLAFNPAAEKIFGHTANAIIGKSLNVLIPTKNVAAHNQHIAALTHHKTTLPLRMGGLRNIYGLHRDGSEIPLEVVTSATPNSADGQSSVIAIVRDISERRAAEQKIRIAQNELEHRVKQRTSDLREEITKHERTQDILLASEKRFKDFAESASDWLWESGQDHTYTYFSKKAEQALSIPVSQLLGKKRWEVPGIETNTAQWKRHREDLDAHKPIRNFEYKFTSSDHKEQYFRVNATPVFNKDGDFQGYRGTGSDITVERRLHMLERQLADAISVISEGFVLYDSSEHLVMCNQRYRDMLPLIADHLEPGVLLGDTLEACFDRGHIGMEDSERESWKAGRLAEYRTPPTDGVLAQLPDGRWVSSKKYRTDDGGIVEIRTDITLLKKAEQTARENEERFRAIAEALPIAIFIASLNNDDILYFNAQFEKLSGGHKNVRLVETTWEVTADGLALSALMEQVSENKPISNREVKFRNNDGSVSWGLLSLHQIYYDGEDVIMGAIADDTESRKTQAQLVQASKLATLGEMATATAHELNQPLNIIRMTCENLSELLLDEKLSQHDLTPKLTRITNQVERAASIVDHMRIFGRKSDESFTTLPLNNAIFSAVDMMREQFRLHEIDIRLEMPETSPLVLGSQVQVEQVILVLLTNARDAIEANHTNNQSTPERVTIYLNEDHQGGGCQLRVHDTGGGIMNDDASRIFEPFYTTKEVGKGTGLGLSVIYGIIQDMSGDIAVENIEGGAQFTVTLPTINTQLHPGLQSMQASL